MASHRFPRKPRAATAPRIASEPARTRSPAAPIPGTSRRGTRSGRTDNADEHAAVHPAHKRLLEEAAKPRIHGCAVCPLVQFRPYPQDAADLTRDGGRDREPALVDGGRGCADRRPVGKGQRRNADRRLSKDLFKQDRLILAPELDIESDAGDPRPGNFELNGLDLMLVEPRPHFVHGLTESRFRLFDAYRKGWLLRHVTRFPRCP